MYEFCSKEVKEAFKKTEYGKKTNRWLHVSLAAVGVVISLAIIFCSLLFNKVISIEESVILVLSSFISGMFSISIIISCYFDGKRDGAIEQFKIDNNKK